MRDTPECEAGREAGVELATRLSVAVLGPFRVAYAGREVRIRSRKAQALLAYLLLGDAGVETRDRLVGLLWSESGEDKARASLRQVLHELRETLEAAGCHDLRVERATVGISLDQAELDAQVVLQQAGAMLVHPLVLGVPKLADGLLQGLDDLDPAFRVWLLAARQAFHDRLTRALEAGLWARGQEAPARRRLAHAILQLDPTHEEACRALMRACAEAGDAVAALRAYEALWHLLAEDYDAEPSAATQQLVADIKLGRLEPAAAVEPSPAGPAAARAAPARIALQVEPFSVNGVAGQMHLVQGFRHDLIARLVRFREWFVVDGPAPPRMPTTGPRVSGLYRISATAYQLGDRISMVLTLADQDTGVVIWSERLDLTLDGWFEVHQRIVRRIVIALNLQVSAERLSRLAAEPDVSLAAYDSWLRGQAMIRRFSPENWERAAHLFQECLDSTPTFSPAYSSLAQMENSTHIVHPGRLRERAREARALAHARRAVELDPTDSRAQLCLGWSHAMAGHHAQASVHMDLALDLNPSDSWTLMSAALFHAFCGDHARARDLAAEALQLTLAPSRTHWGYQVTVAYLAADDAATLDACDRAEDAICTLQAWRAAALANLGRPAEAAAAAERFLRTVRGAWVGAGPPTDEAIVRWLLHLYPIRRARDWERLRRGLAAAGLPTAGSAHGGW